MAKNICKISFFCFVIGSILTGCSKSEAQQDFEEQALSQPSGITEMRTDGTPVEGGEDDPDDWRTAPNFVGLFDVETSAFANPVPFNSNFFILIDVKAIDAINGLYVYAFQQPGDLAVSTPLEVEQQTLQPGLQTIIINPQEFTTGNGTGTSGNLYRIIFYDRQQTVITYGDVLVQ